MLARAARTSSSASIRRDFNLGPRAARSRTRAFRTIHYVSPSVWAWRRRRIKKIARAVNRILVMFPFEEPLYEKAGIPVTYVGHPLADVIPLQPNEGRGARRSCACRAAS